MNICAIVPVKPLNRAKSRLSESLAPAQRELLATGLLMRTTGLLLGLPCIQKVLVISRDTKALAMVRELGAHTVQESGAPELNNALLRATQVLRAWNSAASIIVPADIPLLAAEDIEEVAHLGRFPNTVVLVPDRHEQGTNLLFVRPPGLISYAYGEDSFGAHQAAARVVDATVQIYRSPTAALDLDTPEDLEQYYALAHQLGQPAADWILELDQPGGL